MNTQTYQHILDICNTSEVFYFVDQQIGDSLFRMFNYRLASYTDWLIDPITFELRGLMVEIDSNGDFIRVASRPPSKFFNLNENPFVIDIDLHQSGRIAAKLDGSLISTFVYRDGGDMRLGVKSKMSLCSSQTADAMLFLINHPTYYNHLLELALDGITVYCEFCSPSNRIVIGYPEARLTVLGVRDSTGTECSRTSYPELHDWWVDEYVTDDVSQLVQQINTMQHIEGFVVTMLSGPHTGTRFKIKCDWYLSLHHTKDSINNPRRLFEAVIDEAADDLRSLFFDDKLAIKLIDEMQTKVDAMYNHMVNLVETFHRDNKDLDRKSFAIKGRAEIEDLYFGLVMLKYQDRPVDYKGFMKSKYRELGFRDETVNGSVDVSSQLG